LGVWRSKNAPHLNACSKISSRDTVWSQFPLP